MRTALSLIIIILLALPSAYAFQVPQAQKNVKIILNENTETEYVFFIINDEGTTRTIEITCRGDCNIIKLDWIRREIPQYYYSLLPVTITVPSGIRAYNIELLANEKLLAKLLIETTITQSEIKELQTMATAGKEIEAIEINMINRIEQLEAELKSIINSTRENISTDVLSNLQELNKSIEEIAKEQKSIATGSSIATSSSFAIIFVLGLLLGMGIIFVVFNKRAIANRLFGHKRYEFKPKISKEETPQKV
ncbi:MAG: hypothetical protein QXQ40_00765 [Candidatus Aenigmatarchaeota archaeon]